MTLPAQLGPPQTYSQPPTYAPPREPTRDAEGPGWIVLNPFDPSGSARSVERGLRHMERGGIDSKKLLTGMLVMWLVIGGLLAVFVVGFFAVLIGILAIMHAR